MLNSLDPATRLSGNNLNPFFIEYPEEFADEYWKFKMDWWENTNMIISDLTYYTHMSYSDVMGMSPIDRKFQYDLLCEKKKREKEMYSN